MCKLGGCRRYLTLLPGSGRHPGVTCHPSTRRQRRHGFVLPTKSAYDVETHRHTDQADHCNGECGERVQMQVTARVRTPVFPKDPQHLWKCETQVGDKISVLPLAVNLPDHHGQKHVRHE